MTEAQKSVLKTVADGAQHNAVAFDGRSLNALAKRGWIKVRSTKAGSFASITAKGKKELS